MSTILRHRATLVCSGVYLVVSIACTQIPLLNYLGYEFSLVLAVTASFVAGIFTIRMIQRSLKGQSHWPDVRTLFLQILSINSILLVIPLVVMLTNALFVKNCSLLEGLGYFFLLPCVTVFFATSLGVFTALHYSFASTVFTGIFLLSLVYAAALGYYTPAIFSYNFFYGFFPGFSYDETLGISGTVIVFRVMTLFISGILLWMSSLLVEKTLPGDRTWKKGVTLLRTLLDRHNRVVSGILLVCLVTLYFFRCEIGLESSTSYVRARLGSEFSTEHFTLYYYVSSIREDEVAWIGSEHEFRLDQILSALHLPFHDHIESYIYPSDAVKRKLIGAGNTNIAKPWSGQIHLTRQSMEQTLKHELVHVLVAPFGYPIIKASPSTGLVEGLATAIDWEWGNRTPHQYAAAMRKFGVAPDIRNLMTFTGFASHSSSISYVLAGSFCRFLIDRHGIRSMMQVYQHLDYPASYGENLDDLIGSWHAFLDSMSVNEQERDVVDALFRRPPIFRKVCARVVADRNAKARQWAARKEYALASDLYAESYRDGRGFEALAGFLSSEIHRGHFDVVIAALDTVVMKDAQPMQYLPLFLLFGEALWARGDLKRATEVFDRLACANISETQTEAALLYSRAMEDTALASGFLRYILSEAGDSHRVEMLDSLSRRNASSWIPRYVKGKALLRLQRFDESLIFLDDLRPGDPQLEAIRLKSEGIALFRLRRFQEAKARFWYSLNARADDVSLNEVNDWVARCEWMSAHPLK